jgi:hypothetical protein
MTTWEVHRALLLHEKCLEEKHFSLSCKLNQMLFVMEDHFYLNEQLTEKLYLLRLGCFADFFLKTDKDNLSLRGKLTIFVASDKIPSKILILI